VNVGWLRFGCGQAALETRLTKVLRESGQILVYASSAELSSHRVARLVPDGNAFDAFATGSLAHPLTAPPVVDFLGYAFIEPAAHSSQHALAMDRASSLSFVPASLSSWTELLQ
jgi:hypothetical protein